ncbi:MAG: NUDIX hydrolase [Pseudohongiella sp.]|nr:NUDIX hydrolase [Pseudohongiella sp.]MDO9520184.1 NUDIX hydrolase [Pseudohongiella sp.]MDP2125943.1 NUDIX hydrolase [Pseudohongiella sp.]
MKPRPASTVVLVRESAENNGVETLLLLRNSALTFEGGAWVFPGGKVDACDYPATPGELSPGQLDHQAAINAGIRETQEEAGLILSPDYLIPIAHWTTPLGLSRRYATWFFLCPLHNDVEIVVDDDEILDYQWLSPDAALQAHSAGLIRLPVPTAFTLKSLLPYQTLGELCAAMKSAEIHVFPENSDYYQPLARPL